MTFGRMDSLTTRSRLQSKIILNHKFQIIKVNSFIRLLTSTMTKRIRRVSLVSSIVNQHFSRTGDRFNNRHNRLHRKGTLAILRTTVGLKSRISQRITQTTRTFRGISIRSTITLTMNIIFRARRNLRQHRRNFKRARLIRNTNRLLMSTHRFTLLTPRGHGRLNTFLGIRT